jgi:hypothetical protein
MRKSVGALLSVTLLAGCTATETLTCRALNERSMSWREPKVALWQYQGSHEGFHYFHFVDLPLGHRERYRVPSGEIEMSDPFPLTTDRTRWRSLPWGPLLFGESKTKGVPYDICARSTTRS